MCVWGDNMKKIAFDNDYYLKIQRNEINKRINQFGDKLYLEFGGLRHTYE